MEMFIETDRAILSFFNGSDSLFLDNISVILTSGLTWIPLYVALFYVVVKNNETMRQIMLVIGCTLLCVALTAIMADLIVKPLVARPRPTYDPILKYSIRVVDNMRASGFSFFSAHAANTFGLAVFFSLLIRNFRFVTALIAWSLLNCWTRLYLGVHYPSDIFVGLIWGAFAGCFAYYVYIKVYLRMHPDFNYVSSQYTSTGYSNADVDIVLFVLTITFLYSIVRALIF